MQNQIKKNMLVVVALLLPVLLIVGVLIASKLQSALVNTQYNFVYAICDYGNGRWHGDCDSYLSKTYMVINQRITIDESPMFVDRNYDGIAEADTERPTMRVFLHDTKRDLSRELLEEEIRALTIDSRLTSPDGVTVEGGSSRGGGIDGLFFSFGSSYTYEYYLTKGSNRSLVNLSSGQDNYYGGNFKFIGWVIQ